MCERGFCERKKNESLLAFFLKKQKESVSSIFLRAPRVQALLTRVKQQNYTKNGP
jgi:hypothetical protein